MPFFSIDGDTYNAAAVASIGIAEGDDDEQSELYVILVGTSIKDAICYSYDTETELYEQRDRAVAAWKAALKKLYE